MTEMVNNAIDHSDTFTISFSRSDDYVEARIEDEGVGAFKTIMRAFDLPDERQALLELHKRKATSAPDAHSGQGVFFTSRAMDDFLLASGRLVFSHGDVSAHAPSGDEVKGTRVRMGLRLDSKRQLVGVFDEFTILEAGGFTKTQVPVRVAQLEGRVLVSRSQAERVLSPRRV